MSQQAWFLNIKVAVIAPADKAGLATNRGGIEQSMPCGVNPSVMNGSRVTPGGWGAHQVMNGIDQPEGDKMFAPYRIGTAVIAWGLVFGGCVSTGTFNEMQAKKDKQIATLQKENADLVQQKDKLEGNFHTLKERFAELEQKRLSTEQQVGSLQQENAALAASSQQQQQQYQALVQGLSNEVRKGQLQVRQYQNMLTVDLAEKIFFDSGRATLKPAGKEILKKVGEALKGYDTKIIRVVGHTDNVPVAKSLQGTFPTNWELSVARATTVVRYLQEVGVPPERLVASGRAEYDPVASNDTPEGRQKNRRIEIMLIDKSLVDKMTAKPAE
ncbi:MAG TPA: OmpA family protein [Nitrospiria bacterium]|nr:OmpA family protein [Nitrospiria bacterium]